MAMLKGCVCVWEGVVGWVDLFGCCSMTDRCLGTDTTNQHLVSLATTTVLQ